MIARSTLNRLWDRRGKLLRRAGAVVETFSRVGVPITNQATSLTSGAEYITAIPVTAGMTITSVTFVSGTTAADTPTNQWMTVRDKDRKLLGITADDTTAAWAASTAKTLTLTTPVKINYDGIAYLGLMVKATTPPSVLGLSSSATLNGLTPVIAVKTQATTLTDPASAQSQITSFNQSAIEAYAYAS